MTEDTASEAGGIARIQSRLAHWLRVMEARERPEHQATGGTAGDGTAVATAWRPIGETEAPRLVAALVEPKEAHLGNGQAGAMAGNARPQVALAAIALGTAILGAAWWIARHRMPARASLPGTGTPGSAAFARPGDTPGAIQEPEVNKQIAAAVVAGVAATGGANAQTAVQWRVQDGGNGHWYQFVSDLGDWDDGVSSAIRHGAHLATCPSAAESGFVRSVAAGRRVYLGGHQPIQNTSLEPAAGWVWVTGEPWSYANWEMNEPNNLGTTQHWLAMIETGEWDDGDIDASNVIGFIFEWSADCNNDGIVDFGQVRDGSVADANGNGVPDACECAGADITANGTVDGADLGALLAFWGPAGPVLPEADLSRDGIVDGEDLGILLSHWGPCGG